MNIRLLPLLLLFLILSCSSSEVCTDEDQSEMVARFKTVESESIKDTILEGVTIRGIREGVPGNLLYDSSTLSRIVLPLDPNNSNTTFLVKINGQTDTIRVNHITEFYMKSHACGFASLFKLENAEVSGSMIFNTEITKSQVDAESEQNEEHLWIYF